MLGCLLIEEEIQLHPPATAGLAPLWHGRTLPGEGENTHPCQGLAIQREYAVAGSDHHLAQIVRVHGLHLENTGIVSPGGAIGPLDEFHPLRKGGFGGSGHHRVEIVAESFVQIEFVHFARAGGDACRHSGSFPDFFG